MAQCSAVTRSKGSPEDGRQNETSKTEPDLRAVLRTAARTSEGTAEGVLVRWLSAALLPDHCHGLDLRWHY